METIGSKIATIRKQKGMTQEKLSELAKINLRTIQRIEKDENEPRGVTLKLICEALDSSIEEIIEFGKFEDKKYLFFLHLSVLSVIVIPLGNIIFPLLLWINKRDNIYDVNNQGKNILNFQILFTFVNVFILGVGFSAFSHYLDPKKYFLIYYFLLFLNVSYSLYSSYSVLKGRIKLYYPQLIIFLK